MASLQASLRGQATFGAIDLAELMARVNRLLCDSSSREPLRHFLLR